METAKLKRFAQYARCSLIDQVSTMLDLALSEDSVARREEAEAVRNLEHQIERYTKDLIIERVAYTWFNRFCALRFMDENRYSRIGVVSPAIGEFLPEILSVAKTGHIDQKYVQEGIRKKVLDLLNENVPSQDPQGEAYRMLLVAVSNYWHKTMPFLFQRINDYTELLIPYDLLSGNSILAYTREAMTPGVCRDVEVIGWLYQYYISEKKDKVFADLKKNRKIHPESIPAATQLFTPSWIVRYLVENSLGRLWMLNHPESGLIERMDYYIRPDQLEADYLRIDSPEEIKVCDPACGSGHMLTYAFDLLYDIYEEQGYSPQDIPEKILENNLHGIEIDERAGELAALALTMKARDKHRQFFDKGIKPNICVLEPIHFEKDELDGYMDFIGRDLFSPTLQVTLHQFEEADNFGSLILPEIADAAEVLNALESKDVRESVLFSRTHEKVLKILRQSIYLSDKHHAVIANPPYMGSRNMNSRLAQWLKSNYPDSSSDVFASFIERSLEFVHEEGLVAMITMQSWMFLSSFQAFRQRILNQETILSMAHLGPNAFDSIGGHVVMTTAFVLEKKEKPSHQGGYVRLLDGESENIKSRMMRDAIHNPDCGWFYRASSSEFQKIPGSPIAYWAKENNLINVFNTQKTINDLCDFTGSQNKTANNDKYLRMHWEVSRIDIGQRSRWVPYAKGGGNRKWFGLLTNVVDWSEEAIEFYKTNPTSNLLAEEYRFRSGITYSELTSSTNTFRFLPNGCIYDMK
ncbi:MAG: BREX-1 system adenine-specific DNA-methyltransferase PglX, partial [Gammaproteobacteria bacterium]|nr:BREX-1 system adenine-specific DNA-methyltransferase PglX [Gammaproteobacteria bacterium]